jgi:lysyl-tRNA synthetase class 2
MAHESETFALKNGDQVAIRIEKALQRNLWEYSAVEVLQTAGREVPPPSSLAFLKAWPRFLADVRNHFLSQGLAEVPTPSLVSCPGLEPSLEPFAIETAFLPTSPEIHLKKALCRGWTDIFEIKSCFRKGERSSLHREEFQMLEWYRAFSDLDQIVADLQALLEFLDKAGWVRDRSVLLERTSFQEILARQLDFSLTARTDREEWVRLCERLQIDFSDNDSSDDLFHRVWFEKLEPEICAPTVVWGFPPTQAALARIHPSGFADRLEFYWGGIEIANAFHEVNDADEQVERWQKELQERRRLGTSELPMDLELIDQMKDLKMPPTAGIALGLERLFMVCQGVKTISKLYLF